MRKKGNHRKLRNIFLLVSIAIICGYFLWQGTGITGAIIGVEKADIDDKILGEFADNEEVSVIITFEDDNGISNLEEQKEIVKKNQEKVIGDLNLEDKKGFLGILTEEKEFEIGQQYSVINAISGTITEEGLKKLERNPRVKKISYDYPISPFLSDSVPLINAGDVWSYDIGGVSVDGSGETICIIDTGVDYTHPALGNCTSESFLDGTCGKVVGGFDYGGNDSDPFPSGSFYGTEHGTHVAGIAASEDDVYRGVAPGASIVAMRVFTDQGSGLSSWAISAIDWCVNNASKFNISVISMSVGVIGAVYSEYCDSEDSFAEKSSWAASQGMFVAAAAGNSGASGLLAPACGENVTSVGGTTKSDGISGYNTAPILSVLAPGNSITSTILSGSFGSKSGTSMSTPHAAGTAALFSQYWKLAYNITPTSFQIRDKLRLTGKLINDTRNGILFPRVDILKAIQPWITFASDSITDETEQIETNALINITSDIDLSTAILEWNYADGSSENITMNQSSPTNFYYLVSELSLGDHSYSVRGNDSVNTFGISDSRTLSVIPILPNITINNPSDNYYNRDFTLNIFIDGPLLSAFHYNITNSSDDLIKTNSNESINDSSFEWVEEINISSFVDDNYTLVVFVEDSVGNSVVESIGFEIDKTKPILSGADRIPEEVYNNDTIFFYINVTEINLDNVLISGFWDGEWEDNNMSLDEGERYVFNISELSDGDNISYKFSAIDLVGNEEETEIFSFVVQEQEEPEIENSVPVVNITSPLNGSVMEFGEETQFNATAEDADGDNLTYFWNFDDGTNSTEQAPLKRYNETGEFNIEMFADDGEEESDESKITLFVNDSLVPEEQSITFDDELDKDQYSIQEVTATFFDLSGISGLSLSSGNSTVTLGDHIEDGNTWTYSWNITLPDSFGSETFIIEAVDNSSNKNSGNLSYEFSVISCGDGVVNGLEDCDGSVFDDGDNACPDWGNFDGGVLSCGDDCNVDTSECTTEDDSDDTSDDTTESETSSAGGSSGGGSAPSAPVETTSEPEPVVPSVPEPVVPEEPTPAEVVEEVIVEETVAVEEVVEEEKGFFTDLTGMIARNMDFNQWDKKQKIIAGSSLSGVFLLVVLLTVFLIYHRIRKKKTVALEK